jgi:hypothetical protein
MSDFWTLLGIAALIFVIIGFIAKREDNLKKHAAALLRDYNDLSGGGHSENGDILDILKESRRLELRATGWGQIWSIGFLIFLSFALAALAELVGL